MPAIRNLHEPTLRERMQEHNAMSSQSVVMLAAQGKRATLWGLVFVTLLTFLRSYLWQGQWRHGIDGLVSAVFSAYAVFVCHMKLWEHHHAKPPTLPSPRP